MTDNLLLANETWSLIFLVPFSQARSCGEEKIWEQKLLFSFPILLSTGCPSRNVFLQECDRPVSNVSILVTRTSGSAPEDCPVRHRVSNRNTVYGYHNAKMTMCGTEEVGGYKAIG